MIFEMFWKKSEKNYGCMKWPPVFSVIFAAVSILAFKFGSQNVILPPQYLKEKELEVTGFDFFGNSIRKRESNSES